MDPGFGRVFTDHMAVVRYNQAKGGWHEARVEARANFPLDPAGAVLHYAQEIFEGLKAYKSDDGGANLFRPTRMRGASRSRPSGWRCPNSQKTLPRGGRAARAHRPRLDAGRRGQPLPAPVHDRERDLPRRQAVVRIHFRGDRLAGRLLLQGRPRAGLDLGVGDYTRAAVGGTGAVKCGGNYAASLRAQAEAIQHGCDQVVFLDAIERRYIEELGGMNVFFVFDDGSLSTPPLGTILPGITRDSIIALAKDAGKTVREEPYSLDQWRKDAASGKLKEAFACGTAAVISPIGTVRSVSGDFEIAAAPPAPSPWACASSSSTSSTAAPTIRTTGSKEGD